ncbi:MAG: hypothetical protein LBO66_03920 [Deltaproteobacteria bacterium]|jgi:hypothetical protein|nr:hypothetical protein [Deltaproteobacteria bacterium]
MPQPFSRAFSFLWLVLAPLAALFSGCGVITDMVHDNELRIGFLNNPDFVSPAKLRVGVFPFDDMVDLGNAETGAHIAALVTEQFARNEHLLMVPPAEMRAYAESRGLQFPLTAEEAVQICRDLNLNIVMEGTISALGQSHVRTGWRKILRWFSDQQRYVEAMLSLRAYDSADGAVVTARASDSRLHTGDAPEPGLYGERESEAITQEEAEETLDDAIEGLYFRSLDGLKVTPFKAPAVAVDGGEVTIPFGEDVSLRRGSNFVVLSYIDELVNQDNVVYRLPGPPQARLRVESVGPRQSVLSVSEGYVNVGDIVQSWEID